MSEKHNEDTFRRMPGLFRRWEFEQIIDVGYDFRIEEAGTVSGGAQLFAVYRRRRNQEEGANAT